LTKTCIIIAGPTAVGKTAFAIDVAKHFSTQIISADSRQCYREMNIGVARPSAEELEMVPHYFIASHSIHQNLNAVDFENYALECLEEIFKSNDVAVMVGGTGLYIQAFCEGLHQIPEVDEKIRNQIIVDYQEKGIAWLQSSIQKEDSLFAAKGEIQNPQRMMRALEIVRATGKSIFHFRSPQKKQRNFSIVKIGLELPRAILYERINQRVNIMMEQGLLEEAKKMYPYKTLNALQTVGYRELFQYFDGDIDLNRATELIKQHSRHYAKRQLTWFKKDEQFNWVQPPFSLEKLETIKKG